MTMMTRRMFVEVEYVFDTDEGDDGSEIDVRTWIEEPVHCGDYELIGDLTDELEAHRKEVEEGVVFLKTTKEELAFALGCASVHEAEEMFGSLTKAVSETWQDCVTILTKED